MPLTALELWNASTMAPADLGNIVDDSGEPIIPIDGTPAQQFEAAVAWVGFNVLPGASAEIGVPVRGALGDYDMIFTNTGLEAKFGTFALEVIPLWDAAQTNFGRSELNKRIDSNNVAYDKDSDQDRIYGNQRLQKLLDALATWKSGQDGSGDGDNDWTNGKANSSSVSVRVVW